MLPIQKILRPRITDELLRYHDWVQVKDGLVTLTNGIALLRVPVGRVFGEVEGLPEHFYFDIDEWTKAKGHTASEFKYRSDFSQHLAEGASYTGELIAFNRKKTVIGRIGVVDQREYELYAGEYLNVENVIPDPSNFVPVVACNTDLLNRIAGVLGCPALVINRRLEIPGHKVGYYLESTRLPKGEGITALIMGVTAPTVSFKDGAIVKETKDDLSSETAEIAKLKEQINTAMEDYTLLHKRYDEVGEVLYNLTGLRPSDVTL